MPARKIGDLAAKLADEEPESVFATFIIGGIITSTLLTLLVLPASYRLVHACQTIQTDPKEEDHQ